MAYVNHVYCLTGVWLLMLSPIAVIRGREIHVSHAGKDSKQCGSSPGTACKTVAYAVAHSGQNDVIDLEPADRPYTVEPLSGDFIDVTHILMIRSVGGTAKLNCTEGKAGVFHVFDANYSSGVTSKLVTLTLHDIQIIDCAGTWNKPSVIKVSNAAIKIHNCTFANSGTVLHHAAVGGTSCDRVVVSIIGSTLRNCGFIKPYVPCIQLANCSTLSVTVTNVSFENGAVKFQAEQNLNLQIKNVTLSGENNRGPALDVKLARNQSIVTLTDMSVGHQRSRSSPVVIVAGQPIQSSTLHFANVRFINNSFTKELGGALALIVRCKIPITLNVLFTDCTFSGNSARDAGGALYIEGVDGVRMNHCTFKNNVAVEGGAILIAGSTNVNMFNTTFIQNQATGMSQKNYLGLGGALRILQSDLVLTQCIFKENKAGLWGQSIHATDLTSAYITLSTFLANGSNHETAPTSELYLEQSQISASQNPGMAVRLTGNTFIDNNTATQHGLYNIQMKGQMDISENTVCCPAGHYMDHLIQPQYNLPGFDTGSSTDYVWCTACPIGTYSLGQTCFSADDSTILKGYKRFCVDCPEFATCLGDGQIMALRNYWGLKKRNGTNDVRFLLCPAGYCDPEICHGIQCCSNNRTGVLCGKCQPEHDFHLGTDSCIPKSGCHKGLSATVLWPVAFGLIYIVLIALFVMVSHFLQESVTATTVKDLSNNATWRNSVASPDERAWSNDSHQRSVQTVESQQRSQSESDEGSDNFEPTLMPGPAADDSHSILALLNEETQTSGQMTEKVRTPTQLNLVSDLSYVLCVFWMSLQLLEDVYCPSYGNSTQNTSIRIILDLINLRPIYYAMMTLCTSGEVATLVKISLTLITVGTMFMIVIIMLILSRILLKVIASISGMAVSHRRVLLDAFVCKMIVVSVMLTYLPVLKSCLQLVHCIPVHPDSPSVMFINGTVSCNQWWQWLVIIFMATNLAPVGLMIWISLPLIKGNVISHLQFIAGLVCPLAAIFYWTIRHCHLTCRWLFPGESRLHVMQSEMYEANQDHFLTTDMIYSFFTQPFTMMRRKPADGPTKNSSKGWIAFTFARAFILASISVMLNHVPHIMSIIMVTLLSVAIVVHIQWQPYGSRLINCTEASMLGVLIILAVLGMSNSLAYIMGTELYHYLHNIGYINNLVFMAMLIAILVIYLTAVIYHTVSALISRRKRLSGAKT
ncbi:hypothetical protein LSH36_77g02000 [Paralvinella palmiformis]|uniref:Right handed beta helix domain-containing protein n=1 Tax=Paralvinella palmiformis TaxID=53620 RepID=A0AAD9K428_9ANNE|nr:hypothetical protein LSH36_77g02000 [Paralvinella palmiformis]